MLSQPFSVNPYAAETAYIRFQPLCWGIVFFPFYIHLKLELLTQVPASNDEKYVYLGKYQTKRYWNIDNMFSGRRSVIQIFHFEVFFKYKYFLNISIFCDLKLEIVLDSNEWKKQWGTSISTRVDTVDLCGGGAHLVLSQVAVHCLCDVSGVYSIVVRVTTVIAFLYLSCKQKNTLHIVVSELNDPICHSDECQIGSFSSEATI